jgi:hypothetical protein
VRPRYDIAVKLAWDASTNTSSERAIRAADCFMFCLHHATEPDPALVINPSQWEFFVVATRHLNRRFPGQRTLGLAALRRLVDPVPLGRVRSAVDSAVANTDWPTR